ncbi:MAG TPA: chromate transporter [Candidatus Limiplasma sp.]|nr:chromate transporter [Candidatus Limiplasma sp.]HRX08662.1 chromate transporter [Candidatus Limiplasma sp.]
MIYLQLAFEFFKAGLFAIGGGLATLPFLIQMSQNYPQWFSIDQLMQMVAVSESTPGAIGVNMASYVGYHVAGIFGSLTATFALVLPAFLTIAIVVRVLDRFKTNRRIIGAMEAMRPAVTGLIAAAGYTVLQSVLFTAEAGLATLRWIPLILFMILFFLQRIPRLQSIHPVAYIAAGAVLGIAFQL